MALYKLRNLEELTAGEELEVISDIDVKEEIIPEI